MKQERGPLIRCKQVEPGRHSDGIMILAYLSHIYQRADNRYWYEEDMIRTSKVAFFIVRLSSATYGFVSESTSPNGRQNYIQGDLSHSTYLSDPMWPDARRMSNSACVAPFLNRIGQGSMMVVVVLLFIASNGLLQNVENKELRSQIL